MEIKVKVTGEKGVVVYKPVFQHIELTTTDAAKGNLRVFYARGDPSVEQIIKNISYTFIVWIAGYRDEVREYNKDIIKPLMEWFEITLVSLAEIFNAEKLAVKIEFPDSDN